MKIKSIIILSIILAIISIASVSAAENVTDEDLTVHEEVINDINVTVPEQVWEEDLGDIEVELPEKAEGNFTLKIDETVIYNQPITNKSVKVPIKLPVYELEYVINIYPPMDSKNYKVSAFYNNVDLNINKTLKVMRFPPDYNRIFFPEEILQNSARAIIVFPRSANGIVEFYLDDKLINKTQARPTFYFEDTTFSKLKLGKHTFKVIYNGDKYYRPFTKTFEFLLTNVVIDIPNPINISHDDCISVETARKTQGKVKVYIDGKLIDSGKTYKGSYILSLENYVKYTDHEIKVVYSNKEFSRTKTVKVNMTYDFDIFAFDMTYGQKNIIEITLPDTLNNKLLNVEINGTKYSFTHPSYIMNNIIEIDVTSLAAGNYSLVVSYPGDGKYYAHSKTYNFTKNYKIFAPYSIVYDGSSKAYLKLPSDAQGNLVVKIDGVLYKSVKFNKGYAECVLDTLMPGVHRIEVTYDGDDYDVASINTTLRVNPMIDSSYDLTEGDDGHVYVKVPENCTGYVEFKVNGKKYKVNIENGVAKLLLKNLKIGEYDIDIDYYGDDGNNISNWRYFTVHKAKFKLLAMAVSFKDVNIKFKLTDYDGKALSHKVVNITFNGKKYAVKTNKKGIAVLKKNMKLKNKKVKVTLNYLSKNVVRKVKVQPMSLKSLKTSKKIILKAILKNKAKNKIITFKINNKILKAKTNKKGIAKVSVKKPSKSRVRIKAVCGHSVVKDFLFL